MVRALWFTLVMVSAVWAGCLSAEDTIESARGPVDEVADWAALALPFGAMHDHFDPTHHAGLSTQNFAVVGHDPLLSDYYGHTSGSNLCGDARDVGERRLGVVHSLSSDVAFVLVDVTDAAAPVPLGELVLPHTGSRDVGLSPDGAFVVVASTGPKAAHRDAVVPAGAFLGPKYPELAAASDAALWRDACRGAWSPVPLVGPSFAAVQDDAAFPPGVLLVDVSTPASPAVVDVVPLPGIGAHSVTVDVLDDEPVVIASVTNLASPAVSYYFFGIDAAALGARLVLDHYWQDRPTEGGMPLINGHADGWVQRHPVTGQALAYIANWHQGVVILDLSAPVPSVVGRYTDYEGPTADIVADNVGNVHSAIPLEGLWAGRHYTFIGQEILEHPSARVSGWVRVLDTTDPSSPRVVAEWSLPVDVEWGGGAMFSPHYLDLWNGTLFVAHYHAGVWALDVGMLIDGGPTRAAGVLDVPAVGVFVPSIPSPEPAPRAAYTWAPTVMDANVLPGGDIVVWDSTTGVYVVRFDAGSPAPPAWPLRLDGA